jgi:hypothetical protein
MNSFENFLESFCNLIFSIGISLEEQTSADLSRILTGIPLTCKILELE